jgi:hypothetical protein
MLAKHFRGVVDEEHMNELIRVMVPWTLKLDFI